MTHCFYNCSDSRLRDKHLGPVCVCWGGAKAVWNLFQSCDECNAMWSQVKERCALLLENCELLFFFLVTLESPHAGQCVKIHIKYHNVQYCQHYWQMSIHNMEENHVNYEECGGGASFALSFQCVYIYEYV